MSHRHDSSNQRRWCRLRLVCLLLITPPVLMACASNDNAELAARYENLEAERLDAMRAEQDRVSEQLRQPFSEPARRKPVVVTQAQPAHIDLTSDTPVDQWRLARHPNPETGDLECMWLSPTQSIVNGKLDTSVYLLLNASTIYLRADAMLDLTPIDTGVRVDAGLPVRFEEQINDVTAAIKTQRGLLNDRLVNGEFVTATFAYAPQRGNNETHEAAFTLQGLNLSAPTSNCR